MSPTDTTRTGRRKGDPVDLDPTELRRRDGIEIVEDPPRRRKTDEVPRRRTTDRTAPSRTRASGVVVDARLKARRVEVMRSEGRRRLHTLIGLVAVTAVGLGLLVLIESSWLDVDEVRFEGVRYSDAEVLQAATAIELGQPLLEVDVDRALLGLQAQPWILSAGLDRRLDGAVVVSVVERSPAIALPGPDGAGVLVDETGRQLGPVSVLSEPIPSTWLPVAGLTVSGEYGTLAPPEAIAVIDLQNRLDPALHAAVAQVSVDDAELSLDLSDGGRVRLGRGDAIEEKLTSLRTILEYVELRCLYEIDVRVPTVPAVTRVDAEGNPGVVIEDLETCS